MVLIPFVNQVFTTRPKAITIVNVHLLLLKSITTQTPQFNCDLVHLTSLWTIAP